MRSRCITQGAQPGALWWPRMWGGEADSRGRGYKYNYSWFMLYSKNQQNIVKQESTNWYSKHGLDPRSRKIPHATKQLNHAPQCHNYGACVVESANHNCWNFIPQLLKLTCPRTCALQQRSHQKEKLTHHN